MTAQNAVHSDAIVVRNELLARLKKFPTFVSVARFGRSKMRIIQPEHIPYLAVYLMEENLGSDGDFNAGEPRFKSRIKIGFSYIIQNSDPDATEDILDLAYQAIMHGLLNQPRWQFFANGGLQLEGVEKGMRKSVYHPERDNRTPYAELQADLTFMNREDFPPILEDDLNLWVTTIADHIPYDPLRNEPLIVHYDFTGGFVGDFVIGSPTFDRVQTHRIDVIVQKPPSYSIGSPIFVKPTVTKLP